MSLLSRVHVADGYPSSLAEGTAFLVPPYEVASWVAVANEEVVGHVALHRPTGSATAALASLATGLRVERHLVLSRLFTSPDRRGQGLGKRLLAEAQAEAERRGERAVLDVGTAFPAAAALYESAGWLRVGADRQKVGDEVFDVWVYVAPSDVVTAAGWTTDEDLVAARERFAAQVDGYLPPAAYALARRDPDKIVFGHVNHVGAARGLPAAALAVACGYSDQSGAHELTGADVRRVLRALSPAECAKHVPHPNIWSWRELLREADDQTPFVAFYLAREGDEPRSSEDEQFHALAVPQR